MTIVATALKKSSSNPDWAQLPLFDRSKWETVRFGDVVDLVSDTSRNPEAEGITRYIGLEHLEPGSLHIKTWGELVDGVTFTKRCRKGQVLFGKRRAYQRKVAVAEFEALVSGDIYVFQAKEELLDPKLLPFICMSERFFQFAVETSAGSLSPRTNWSHLAEFEFALPPLDQQRRIAELLWAVDEVMESYRDTRRTNGAACARSREAHFEDATSRQSCTTITAAGKWFTGNTPSRQDPQNWGDAFPWASPKDMKIDVLSDTEEHLTDKGKALGTIVPRKSLMIVVRGMILAHTFPVCITGSEMAFNQDMKALVPNERFMVEYIFHWFKWLSQAILGKTSTTSHGTKRLMMDDFTGFALPELDLKDQRAFVDQMKRFDEVDKTTNHAQINLIQLRTSLVNSFS